MALTTLSTSISQVSHTTNNLYDMLALALKNNPTLQQTKANYRTNHKNMIQNQTNLLPNLNTTNNTTHSTFRPSNKIQEINQFTKQPQIQAAHNFKPNINNHN